MQQLVRLPKTMSVRANPSHCLDEDGQPAAAVPWPDNPNRFIGAELDLSRHKAEGRWVFNFSDVPVVVPSRGRIGQYFANRLRDGELLPACDVSRKYAPKERQ
jgi:hypothetical protein